ncbi:hypothetical protein, partial [Devosia sp. LjRoot3]|uniref:hypothetical protein n=1 Tax=Devosia sp. LjRoot3 TaxID=3342319 RepID=UPI003F5060C6
PHWAERRRGNRLIFASDKTNSSSGCPADRLPCQRSLSVGTTEVVRVVSVAVSSEVLFHCQSLFSIFFSVRFKLTEENFEVTSKSDCSFFSVACRSSFRRLAPRSAAVSGVIGMTFGAVNPLFQTP